MRQSSSEKTLQVLAKRVLSKRCTVFKINDYSGSVPKVGVAWGNKDGWISLRSNELLIDGFEIFFALKNLLPENVKINIAPPPDKQIETHTIQVENEIVGMIHSTTIHSLEIKDFDSPMFIGGVNLVRAKGRILAEIQGNYYLADKITKDFLVLGRRIMDQVRVDLILGTIALPLEKLLCLRPGDQIELTNGEEIPVKLQVGSIPIADGILNGENIRINKLYTKLSGDHSELSI